MGLQALPFPLFSRGDKQRFRNLLGGHWGGIDLQEFDLGITVSEGRSSNTTWYSCAVTQVPAWCQTLTIGAEHLMERVTGELLGHNVPFESEQFQRTFNVSCEDARFASAFVDARMMAWLLA